MKTLNLFILFLLLFNSNILGQRNLQDIVYLKNGSVIHGIIIEQVPNQTIKVQTKDGNIFVFKVDEIEKIIKEAPKVNNDEFEMKRRIPMAAFGLSFLMPGAGQFYNHQWVKGGIFLGCLLGVGVVALINSYGMLDAHGSDLQYCLAGAASLIWMVSLLDAPLSSHMVNQKNKISDFPKLSIKIYENNTLILSTGSAFQYFKIPGFDLSEKPIFHAYLGIRLK